MEVSQVEPVFERVAAELRREMEELLDDLDAVVLDVVYAAEAVETCAEQAGTRYGQTVLVQVPEPDQAGAFDLAEERWSSQGLPVERGDGGEVPPVLVEVDGGDGEVRQVDAQGEAIQLDVLGPCVSAEVASEPLDIESLLAIQDVVLEPVVTVDTIVEDSLVMVCDGGSTELFALEGDAVDGASIESSIEALAPFLSDDVQLLRHGDRAFDVLTDQGTVSLRVRAGVVSATVRTGCASDEP